MSLSRYRAMSMKRHLPLVNHHVHNYKPGVEFEIDKHHEAAYATGGHIDGRVPGKVLKDANPILLHSQPRAQESLMYFHGQGGPLWNKSEPVDVSHIHNGRTLEQVNQLDFSNYYKFTK